MMQNEHIRYEEQMGIYTTQTSSTILGAYNEGFEALLMLNTQIQLAFSSIMLA